MAAAPFVVMLAVIVAATCGLCVLLLGLLKAHPMRAMIGAIVFAGGAGTGVTLLHWLATKPPHGDTASPHALVHGAWPQTRLRFVTLKWMSDGTSRA